MTAVEKAIVPKRKGHTLPRGGHMGSIRVCLEAVGAWGNVGKSLCCGFFMEDQVRQRA